MYRKEQYRLFIILEDSLFVHLSLNGDITHLIKHGDGIQDGSVITGIGGIGINNGIKNGIGYLVGGMVFTIMNISTVITKSLIIYYFSFFISKKYNGFLLKV